MFDERLNLCLPDWVPVGASRYLAHVEAGQSIRSLAREAGCHASTILRQIRRYETRRDDLLVDLALQRLGKVQDSGSAQLTTRGSDMTDKTTTQDILPDDAEIKRSAPRILRRLNEQGACLAIAKDMDMAVVVRDDTDGQTSPVISTA